MAQEYVIARVKAALKAGKGNKMRAQKLLMQWAAEDTKLLYGLSRAHLGGIIAYHIDRVSSGRAEQGQTRAQSEKPATNPGKEEAFGMEILKAVAGNGGAVFGHEGGSANVGSGRASKRHENALRMIAERTQSKTKF